MQKLWIGLLFKAAPGPVFFYQSKGLKYTKRSVGAILYRREGSKKFGWGPHIVMLFGLAKTAHCEVQAGFNSEAGKP